MSKKCSRCKRTRMVKADSNEASPERQLLYPEELLLVLSLEMTKGRGQAFFSIVSNSRL